MEFNFIVFSSLNAMLFVLLIRYYKNYYLTLKRMEYQFLFISLSFLKYKYQMLELMKIVYDKASETDAKFSEDYEKINKKIEQLCEQYGDTWIKDLQNSLGYETKYKNWKEATKYIDSLIEQNKND